MPSTPRFLSPEVALRTKAPVASSARFAQTEGRPQRAQPLMRQYEVVHLLPNGDIDDFTRIAPATAGFENSFAAIVRGGILKTNRGLVAIEDVLPGDEVQTTANGFQRVLWRGSLSITPNVNGQPTQMTKLIRISADALGFARPASDLMLGPAARLYHRSPILQRVTGHGAAFVPATDFVDGLNVVEVQPPAPVQVFQLGFAAHQRFAVNGVEIDSQNPGTRHDLGLSGAMLDLYMSLFPHLEQIEGFGPLSYPRLSLNNLDFGNAA